MNQLKYAPWVAAGLWTAIAACSASGSVDDPSLPPGSQGDGAAPVDAGPVGDARSDADVDAERPLACGDAGFCETRLPKSDLGTPLSLRSVWLVADSDVWSVTAEGFVLHYDGTGWTAAYRAGHALSTVWATPTGVWAGGETGLVVHKDASGVWTRIETGRTSMIRAISGMSDTDVWFASDDGLLDHFDGVTLAAYPLDVPGIRITTVASRPGLGTYATGYVKGPPMEPGSEFVDHQPYILELLPTSAAVFNPMLQDKRGFIPVSLGLTGSPGPDQKIFVLGYMDRGWSLEVACGSVGTTGALALANLLYPVWEMPVTVNSPPDGEPVPRYATWAREYNDVLLPFTEESVIAYLFRWDSSELKASSLAMGYTFVPRTIFGMHGNAAETWLVGDDFALRRATP